MSQGSLLNVVFILIVLRFIFLVVIIQQNHLFHVTFENKT